MVIPYQVGFMAVIVRHKYPLVYALKQELSDMCRTPAGQGADIKKMLKMSYESPKSFKLAAKCINSYPE